MGGCHAATTAPARTGVFPEIQALRAVAVLLVIGFHLWPTRLPGGFIGVDVFFAISGFLITAHILREVATTGRLQLGRFWARRVRRLLPAAFLVLAVTLVAAVALLPEVVWQRTVVEVAASATYVQNWVLGSAAVDYFAADNTATAAQHYWSLSVEEQFYLAWPLLILAAIALARRRGHRPRPMIALTIAAVLVGSLAYSIWYSYTTPPAAYFSTLTHAWEFAAGGLLALTSTHLPALRTSAGAAITWVSLTVLVACGFIYDGAMAFPGWVAVIPVGATLAVIAAGDSTGSRLSPMPMLRVRPIQTIGDASYSAYLWHWPLIVLAPAALGRPLDTPARLGLLAATLLLAWGTKVLLEDPVRFSRRFASRRRYAFAFAAGTAAVVTVTSGAVWTGVDQRTEVAVAAAEAAAAQVASVEATDPDDPIREGLSCLGAGAALSGVDCPDSHAVDPDLLLATTSVPRPDAPLIDLGGGLVVRVYGDPDGETTVALVGDSHAWQYMGALGPIAERQGWRILGVRHNDCTPSAPTWTSTMGADMRESCQAYRRALIDALPAADIDLVVTSSLAPRYAVFDAAGRAQVVDAFEVTYRAWTDAGISVVVIADDPGPSAAIGETLECVAANVDVYDPCPTILAEVLEFDAQVAAAERFTSDELTLLDLIDAYCDADTCHSVVGGVVVYSSGAHLSQAFSESLAPYIERVLLDALGRD